MTKEIKSKDFYFELKDGIDILSAIFEKNKDKENLEIEIRIGQIQFDGFKSGLGSFEFFNKIKTTLDTCKDWDKVEQLKTEEICYNGLKKVIKQNGKKVTKQPVMKKERIIHKNLNYTGTPYDIRISVSKEYKVDEKLKSGMGIIRNKNRTSYHFKDYIIDLTEVEQIENNVPQTIYELEVEFKNLNSDISNMYRAHSGLLLIRDMINMCESIEDDCKLVDNSVKNSTNIRNREGGDTDSESEADTDGDTDEESEKEGEEEYNTDTDNKTEIDNKKVKEKLNKSKITKDMENKMQI
jgi:hypothetical protein